MILLYFVCMIPRVERFKFFFLTHLPDSYFVDHATNLHAACFLPVSELCITSHANIICTRRFFFFFCQNRFPRFRPNKYFSNDITHVLLVYDMTRNEKYRCSLWAKPGWTPGASSGSGSCWCAARCSTHPRGSSPRSPVTGPSPSTRRAEWPTRCTWSTSASREGCVLYCMEAFFY